MDLQQQLEQVISPEMFFTSWEDFVEFSNIPSTQQDLRSFLEVLEIAQMYEHCNYIKSLIN
jgi:hypothetical protein